MYLLLGLLYVVLIVHEALRGPIIEEQAALEEAVPQKAQGFID